MTTHSLTQRTAIRVKREDSFGDFARPTVASPGGVLFEEFACSKTNEQIPNTDHNESSGDPTEIIQGSTRVEWSGKAKFRPHGTEGSIPDIDALLRLTFGGRTHVKQIAVTNYANGSGDTVVVAMTRASGTTTTTLTEGVEFTAATSNTNTATSLSEAMLDVEGIASRLEIGTGIFEFKTLPDVLSWTITIADATFAAASDRRVEYSSNATQNLRGSASIHRRLETAMDSIVGCWVNSWKASGAGPAVPVMEFAGGAKDIVTTTAGTVDNHNVSTTKFTTDAVCAEVNSIVALRTAGGTLKSNSGEGFLVTGVSGDEITTEATHGAAASDTVEPFLPAATPNGVPCAGVKGSFVFDGDELDVLSWEVNYATNLEAEEVAFEATINSVIDGNPTTTAKLVIKTSSAQAKRLQSYRGDSSSTFALTISVGNTAQDGKWVKIVLPKVYVQECVNQTPASATATLELTVGALASSRTANDAITVHFGQEAAA